MNRFRFQLVWEAFLSYLMNLKLCLLALGWPLLLSGVAFAAPQLAEFEQLEGRFQQKKLLRELDLEIKTSGTFEVRRPKTGPAVFYWSILAPKPSKICIDDVGILMNGKNLKFTEVGTEVGDQISGMLKIITMDPAKIADSFDIEQKGQRLVLRPKKPASSFFESATLTLDSKGLTKDVVLTEKSKDQIQIEFSGMKMNSKKLAKVEQCPR